MRFQIQSSDGQWRCPRTRRGEKSAAGNPYQVEHDDLFAAIRQGTPYNEAATGATATMTAILGRMATYSGRTVTWEEGFGSTQALAPEQIAGWDTLPLTLPDQHGLYKLPMPGIERDV